jgi:hypothetical protein
MSLVTVERAIGSRLPSGDQAKLVIGRASVTCDSCRTGAPSIG